MIPGYALRPLHRGMRLFEVWFNGHRQISDSDLAGDGKSLRPLNGPHVGRDGIGIVAAEAKHWHVRVAGH